MARPGVQRVVRRNGVIEFDDPDTGNHVIIMDGMTVESGSGDTLAVVSVAVIVSCGACSRRRITPISEYRHGWEKCSHCGSRLFLPPLDQQPTDGG